MSKKWTIMHKDVPVADVDVLEHEGVIINVDSILDIKHAPWGTLKDGVLSRERLNEWFKGRSIPASRANIKDILYQVGVSSTPALSLKSFGLSLSDQYWIKPKSFTKTWSEVDFYQNNFSDDIGDLLLLDKITKNVEFDIESPDNSSDGVLRKRWKQVGDKQILIKGGAAPIYQEPFNEVIASKIMTRLGINHTPYHIMNIDKKPFSV